MTEDVGIGVRAERARRRKFWTVLGAIAVVAGVGGFSAGFVGAHMDADGPTRANPLLAYFVVAAAVAATAYGSWLFYKSVDEVEMSDNLWGSAWALVAYAFMLPAWTFLHWADAAPEPSHWAIYYGTLGVGFVAYGWLKIRRR